jgi:hypothetical protein
METITLFLKNNKLRIMLLSAVFLAFSPAKAALTQNLPPSTDECGLGALCVVLDNESLEAIFGTTEPGEISPQNQEKVAPTQEPPTEQAPIQAVSEPTIQPEQPSTEPMLSNQPAVEPAPKTTPAPVIKKIIKPTPIVKNINAPKPNISKSDSAGRRVCAKKNDQPAKSSVHKKTHMDMECCLDPDEIPNPHCYYPPSKYGKLLKKFQ